MDYFYPANQHGRQGGKPARSSSITRRLAIIVSHPIQYYVPLYRRLAARTDLLVKVFFTWHAGERAQRDVGFNQEIVWDIPLICGYDSETVPNTARRPGTHHFFGLQNPRLVERVLAWNPDAVHITGYAFASHLRALREFSRRNTPVLFRGDSHLIDAERRGWRWVIKQVFLSKVYSWPEKCLYVGRANRTYYEAFGVPQHRLCYCPHSVDISRFAQPEDRFSSDAFALRNELGLASKQVLLFAGKFEPKKQPIELILAFLQRYSDDPKFALLMVGDGKLACDVRQLAQRRPNQIVVLPFQNQTRMPVIYRVGDVFVLPSSHNETWGLAVNEALASGRPALVSNRVGCAADVIRADVNGRVFAYDDWDSFDDALRALLCIDWRKRRDNLKADVANRFSLAQTEETLVASLASIFTKA